MSQVNLKCGMAKFIVSISVHKKAIRKRTNELPNNSTDTESVLRRKPSS